MEQTIVLTGATGFVGSRLLGDILRLDPEARLRLVVRAASPKAGMDRVYAALAVTAPGIGRHELERRVEVFTGDITLPGLGLDQESHDRLVRGATHIIHCAAAVAFTQSLDEARRVNVGGTQNVLAVAREAHEAGTLRRFAYVGTAYVSGDREGRIMEDEVVRPDRFTNTYEQSKYEAEELVRDAMRSMPCTILRPSIIVGDARTGRTLSFNVLYIPLRFISRGLVCNVPGDPGVPMDVVPVDFVSRAIYELACRSADADGRTFHLTMGDNATTVGEVVATALDYFGRMLGLDGVTISFGTEQGVASGRVAQSMAMFDGYVRTNRVFDNRQTMRALAGAGVSPLPFIEYVGRLLDYCIFTNWGKMLAKAA